MHFPEHQSGVGVDIGHPDGVLPEEGRPGIGHDVADPRHRKIGGLIGQLLFLSVGYVVTHPEWRRELFGYRRWSRSARKSALYPFARRIDLSRTTLLGTDEEAVYFFYVEKLGFRPRKQLTVEYSVGTDFLFEMG